MSADMTPASFDHSHVFLGEGHQRAEQRTWIVIWLCGAMMVAEIGGGALFGSIALIADGLHMSTHAGAMLLAALAYRYARRHAEDPRFSFGTGKLGDLAGFASAIVLAMIALLIGWEAIDRVLHPVQIHFREAIPIASLGLAINVASALILSGGAEHHHLHGHRHGDAGDHDDGHHIATAAGVVTLSVFEDDHPPVFRLQAPRGGLPSSETITVETLRADGARRTFAFEDRGAYLQSRDEVPEPHAFTAILRVGGFDHAMLFTEHEHGGSADRDNNMRAAIIHVVADAAVSVFVIVGLVMARVFGWLWMDPLAGVVGACVIASWSYGLIRDTGSILLDMRPDRDIEASIRNLVEGNGDRLSDLHLWRVGPGHLSAILGVVTEADRDPAFYRERLGRFRSLSHVTVEVRRS